jgi:hypothetical protein
MRAMIRQSRAALVIQCAVRQRQAWLDAERRRWEKEMARRNRYEEASYYCCASHLWFHPCCVMVYLTRAGIITL